MSIIVVFIIPESVVNGDWRKVFYNGITGNDRAARAEPSWLEFCESMEEDNSQITDIFSVFLLYFRFFRYKKYPRANHHENQI